MLKAVETLTNCRGDKKVGNHSVSNYVNNGCLISDYYYHYTVICRVNETNKTVSYDNGGWNTSSTTRAINSYKEAFSSYKEVDRHSLEEEWSYNNGCFSITENTYRGDINKLFNKALKDFVGRELVKGDSVYIYPFNPNNQHDHRVKYTKKPFNEVKDLVNIIDELYSLIHNSELDAFNLMLGVELESCSTKDLIIRRGRTK